MNQAPGACRGHVRRPQLEHDYVVGRVLGKGAFGVVRLVTDKKTGEQFACKSISKAKLITKEDVEDIRREVQPPLSCSPPPQAALRSSPPTPRITSRGCRNAAPAADRGMAKRKAQAAVPRRRWTS